MELKNGEIKKQKIRVFCCEGHLGCAVISKYFLEITIGAPVGILVGQVRVTTTLSGTNTVAMKPTKNAPVNLTILPLCIY